MTLLRLTQYRMSGFLSVVVATRSLSAQEKPGVFVIPA